MAVAHAFDEMVELADAARRDDRHAHRVGDRARQRDIVAGFGSVAVHRGQQDFACAEVDDLAGKLDRIDTGRSDARHG